jgi:hypothetical protein
MIHFDEKEGAQKAVDFYHDSTAMAINMGDGEWIQQLAVEVDKAIENARERKSLNALRKIAERLGMLFVNNLLSLMCFIPRCSLDRRAYFSAP